MCRVEPNNERVAESYDVPRSEWSLRSVHSSIERSPGATYVESLASGTSIMLTTIYRELEDGAVVTGLGYDILIQRRSLGELALPSGRLVACDPLTHPGTDPFDIELSPGNYPLKLVIAQLRDETRVAYVILEIQPQEASIWRMATVPDGEEERLGPGEHGYAVVSGLACLMDQETATRLIEYSEIVMYDEDEIAPMLHAQLRKSQRQGWTCASLGHPYLGRGNMALFTAGYGEGLYRTYVGRDAQGEITRIVTDFEVLDMRFPSFGVRQRDFVL